MGREPRDIDAELEAEINAALGDMSVADLVEDGGVRSSSGGQRARRSFEPGSRFEAKIMRVGAEDVFVDLGAKVQGVCSVTQFDKPPEPGTMEDFVVSRYDRKDGIVVLGRAGAVQRGEWDHLQKGQRIESTCTGTNKGGLEMAVGSMRAFMPAGQVDRQHIDDLSVFVGQSLVCEVMEIDREKKNLVLSRRAVLEKEAAQQREKTMATLAVGDVVDGTVRKIMPFGAFVDIGGVDGLVHVSDLSYKRVNNVEDVVHEGQQVRVQVLSIDTENDKIGLGMKQCDADPFVETSGALSEGSEVVGKITKIAAFGAFVEISPGVEGLIHISELAHERVNRVNQIVREGEIVRAKVLSIDEGGRRISLSLKAMSSGEGAEATRAEDNAMAKLKAKFGSDRSLKGGLG